MLKAVLDNKIVLNILLIMAINVQNLKKWFDRNKLNLSKTKITIQLLLNYPNPITVITIIAQYSPIYAVKL